LAAPQQIFVSTGRRSKPQISTRQWHAAVLATGDSTVVLLCSMATAYLRMAPPRFAAKWVGFSAQPMNVASFSVYASLAFIYAVLVIFCAHFFGLYEPFEVRATVKQTLAIVKAVAAASMLLGSFVFLSQQKIYSRAVFLSSALLSIAGLALFRGSLCKRRQDQVRQGRLVTHALIIAHESAAMDFRKLLRENPELGIDSCVTIEPRLYDPQQLRYLIHKNFIDEVIVITNDLGLLQSLQNCLAEESVGVRLVPENFRTIQLCGGIEQLAGIPFVTLKHGVVSAAGSWLKRMFDVVVAVLVLIAASPIAAAVVFAIKLSERGPVLFRSTRVGLKGRKFTLYKFRTMVQGAERQHSTVAHLNERDGILFKAKRDPRITRLGRFLRKYSIDELPQLINVIKGDMSLVGPRPPLPSEVERYETLWLKRLQTLPGLTGLWQVNARENPSFHEYISLDLLYVECRSFALDLKILAKTVAVVLRGTGS